MWRSLETILNGVQPSDLTEVFGELVHQVPDVLVRRGFKMGSPMVSEPPFSPGLAPTAGDTVFSPISPENPDSGAFQKIESWLQPPKAAHPCVQPEHTAQEAVTLDREKAACTDAAEPFLAAREFVWRNLCRSFYVERSTADETEKSCTERSCKTFYTE